MVDRLLLKNHIDPFTVLTDLTRLAIVGSSGMGALTYKPVIELHRDQIVADFDRLAIECKKLLQTDTTSDDLDELYPIRRLFRWCTT